jgi:hypothetical protein
MNLTATKEYTHLSHVSTWNHEFLTKISDYCNQWTPKYIGNIFGLKRDHKYTNSTNVVILQNSKD